jgi:hypothetical protein
VCTHTNLPPALNREPLISIQPTERAKEKESTKRSQQQSIMSESEIRSLLADGFNPSPKSVPQFEAYLSAQTTGQAPYIFDAVRTLIKLYQLFPETAKEANIAKAFMLTMLAYPSTDLAAISYMVPYPSTTSEPCATIRTCAEQLDACQFKAFWNTLEKLEKDSDADISKLAKTSVPRLQAAILHTLALSYREAPAAVVTQALKMNAVGDVSALKHPAVEKVTADTVVFVATPDNTKRQRVFQEGVSFSAITSLMAKMAQ